MAATDLLRPLAPGRPGPAVTGRVHSGVSRGTLGELYQGPHWEDGVPHISIVSLPVDKFSWCTFTEGGDSFDDSGLCDRSKAARALALFLDHHELTMPPGRLEYRSDLAVGKGMASSTADIVATLRCLFRLFGLEYRQSVVTSVLSRIERADSVFLDEFALYLSGAHRVVRPLGASVGLYACYAVEEGTVDTEEAGPGLLAHYRRHRSAYRDCVEGLVRAFDAGDPAGVAAGAARSAALSQLVLPKLSFDELRANQSGFGADGLFVAHTGTVIGYLFRARPSQAAHAELSEFFLRLGHQCQFSQVGWGSV